jgi:23S rRNA pseudoU1915 N3-methylase RlmH|mmetsp:Transcript_5416/g.8804  ORF Transcript_5416/g.8804 Transcript_5416/m.8804 type:complete len:264 (+) Transcript_5416:81-872(+)
MADFDVALAIADFLADESCSSLKLPHMTTGQRKKTKVLVDKYPELRCESFGFGAERQLHVFKIDASAQDIMPHVVTCSGDSLLRNCSSELRGEGSVDRVDSPECSTRAATDTSGASCSGSTSPQSIDADGEAQLTHARSFINVRNTFIHLEAASIDERTVRSMPHGMFGKCMLADISQRKSDKAIVEEKEQPRETSANEVEFSVGALVIVDGLVKAPAFNGLTAVVEAWDDSSERYRILIGSTSGSQHAMVKRENLKLLLQCP